MFLRTLFTTLILKISLFSCASYWDPNSIQYLFLDKKDNLFLQFSENLNDPAIYNEINYSYAHESKKRNIQEWKKELKDKYSNEQIEDFIYNKNIKNLQEPEAKDYLSFAHEQENCVNESFDNTKPTRCVNFIPKALKKLEEAKSDFYKQRYLFLALRMAHYHKKEPLDIYKKYSHLIENSGSIVKNWIDALYAGAIIKSGDKVQGVYLFSKLFDEAINSHLALYNFFHIRNQKDFDAVLNLAKNSDEKAKIYTLRALDSGSNTIEEMQNIYKLDKNSKWLDFLLYRELLKSQTFFNNFDYFEEKDEAQEDIFYKKYIEFLKTLEPQNRYLVNLSLAYFNIYSKNYDEAKKVLDKLLISYPKSHEVQIASYILYLQSLKKIDKDVENTVVEKIEKLVDENHTSNTIYEYTLGVLASLYKKQGLEFNSFLALNHSYIDYTNLDLEKFKMFEEFLSTSADSKLKNYLQKKYQKQTKNSQQFEFAKVAVLINNLKFKEALNTNFSVLNDSLEFNPFNGLIRGNNRSGKKNEISIRLFLNKIIEIQAILEKNPTSAMDNYLYANALFNLSYFGNSDRVTTTYRSVSSVHTPKLQEEKLNLAFKYYELALNNSNDKELKAKITYQISKVKLALFDLKYNKDGYPQSASWLYSKKYAYGSDINFYEQYLNQDGKKYFDDLKTNYKDTKYYKELLKECSDFRTYINNK